jgi:hypothetical protein
MSDTWETTARTAATTMLRYPDKISDGLEAELYALLEKLGTADEDQPRARASLMMPHDSGEEQHQRHRP